MDSVSDIIENLWIGAGGEPQALSALTLTGEEPALPSSFRMGAVAQATIALAGLAAAEIFRLRTAIAQTVSVDMRHACAEFLSERYYRIDGAPAPELWDRIAGAYQCGDGRWVRIHTNFPHHRDGILSLLQCDYSKNAVQAALRNWQSVAFETAATARGLVVAMMRAHDEWKRHPHAAVLKSEPLFSTTRIGPADRLPFASRVARPLQGVRVLDLTRIIAGPVCTRALAAYGADVLTITGPHLPSIDAVIDTGRGKRTAVLDLRNPDGKQKLAALIAEADIFVQGYRPGGLAALGFGPADTVALNPHIIHVSLSAYGAHGPWGGKRGFDSLVQTATGFNHDEATAAGTDVPRPFPCQALDHGTGFLLAFAAMMALRRRATEGGAWLVEASLAQTGQWLRGLGRLDHGMHAEDFNSESVAAFVEEANSGFGVLTAVRHAAILSKTPAHYALPSMPLGAHDAVWLER